MYESKLWYLSISYIVHIIYREYFDLILWETNVFEDHLCKPYKTCHHDTEPLSLAISSSRKGWGLIYPFDWLVLENLYQIFPCEWERFTCSWLCLGYFRVCHKKLYFLLFMLWSIWLILAKYETVSHLKITLKVYTESLHH